MRRRNNSHLKQIAKRVESIDPEIVGLTCLTFTLDSCKDIIKEVRKVSDAYIAIGGPHIAVAPRIPQGP